MATFNYEAVKDLLRCPRTQAELVFTGTSLVSCDPETRLRFPIVDGFPVMLTDEAVALTHDEWSPIMAAAGRNHVTGEPIAASPS